VQNASKAYDGPEVRVNRVYYGVGMSRLDHHEFDLAAFKGSRRKSVASHLFDDRPICKKVLLRLYLRWELGLQNAALPRVPIRNLKRYRLRSLVDLLFGGLGKFPHTLFLYETLVTLSYWDELTDGLLVRPYYDAIRAFIVWLQRAIGTGHKNAVTHEIHDGRLIPKQVD
jgi:hypothetical protein